MKLGFTATHVKPGVTDNQLNIVYARILLYKPAAIVHGGCIYGDTQIDELVAKHFPTILRFIFPSTNTAKRTPDKIFHSRGDQVVIMPPKDPLVRNLDIIRASDFIIACPRSKKEVIRSGTWMTVRHARRILGTDKVLVINP